jgi:hypothetical protein
MSSGLAAENQRAQVGKVVASNASTLATSALDARVMVTPTLAARCPATGGGR